MLVVPAPVTFDAIAKAVSSRAEPFRFNVPALSVPSVVTSLSAAMFKVAGATTVTAFWIKLPIVEVPSLIVV